MIIIDKNKLNINYLNNFNLKKNENNQEKNNINILEKINFKITKLNESNNSNQDIIDSIESKNNQNFANINNNTGLNIKSINNNNISLYSNQVPIMIPPPKPKYGKIIDNKRVIFGIWNKPRIDSPIKINKKRKRRRLINILNYNKYQEKVREMPNFFFNNNEFIYLFHTNHKIPKNYWHTKVDIISPKKLLGNKSQRSSSEDSFEKLIMPKKRGRKKRIISIEDESDELNDIELSLISELKKNLKKTEGDCELLLY